MVLVLRFGEPEENRLQEPSQRETVPGIEEGIRNGHSGAGWEIQFDKSQHVCL